MSINWDVKDIENYKEVTTHVTDDGKEEWHPVTQTLVWLSLAIDMGVITKENCMEFYTRCDIYESTMGAMGSNEDGDIKISYDEVKSHIGLRTNVSGKTKAQFLKKLFDNKIRENTSMLRKH